MKAVAAKTSRLTKVDLAGGLICLVVTVLVGAVGVLPLLHRKTAFAAEAKHLDKYRKEEAKLSATVATLKRRLADTRETLAKTPLVVSSAAYHVNRRIGQLAELASQSGLTIDEIQPGEPSSSLRFETVPIRLIASGSYPTCVEFLRRLVRAYPDVTVDSFKVSGDPKKPDKPAEFRVNLLWYAAAKPQPWKK